MDSEILVGSETFEDGYWDDEEEYLCLEVRKVRGTRFHYFPEERRSNFISCLPAPIEDLTIRDCTDAMFDCVSDLFLDTMAPKLQTLKVRPRRSVCCIQSLHVVICHVIFVTITKVPTYSEATGWTRQGES
jgi:hypothetical protein